MGTDYGIEIEVIKEDEARRVYEATKHFSPKESMYYLQIMNRLLTTMKNTRLAIITEKRQVEWMAMFLTLDKEQVELMGSQNFEFHISI